MKQTRFLHESKLEEFYNMLTVATKEVQNFHIISEDMIHLEWLYKSDFIPDNLHTNILIANITTCWARLKLCSVIEQLDKRVL